MSTVNLGDQALSVKFEPFGTAGGPVVSFITYSTDSDEPITLQLALDTSEVDGAWNFVSFSYSAESESVYAGLKGGNS